eukprot:SAG31_NODE_3267_length_4478_cov_2.996118_2_plen_180_part_00
MQLAFDVAELLQQEAEASKLQRAMQYYRWVLEHQGGRGELHRQATKAFNQLYQRLGRLRPPESSKLDELDFWRFTSASWPQNVTVQYLSAEPDVLMFDGVLNSDDCEMIAEWQDARHDRLPPSLLCFHDLRHAHESLQLHPKQAWGQSSMLDGVCFTEYASAVRLFWITFRLSQLRVIS